jgi:3-oxoacyl-[acyl-carrier protein] reductase
VTGAAGGLGRAIVTALRRDGARIVAVDQEVPSPDLWDQDGPEIVALVCDVTQRALVDATVDEAIARCGTVDILVNNAGVTRDGLLARMSDDNWNDVLTTNLTGAFHTMRRAAPKMMKGRFGRIVNISSVSGQTGQAGQANYSAAKAGLVGLTRATARELASRGITCNVVAPGPIVTATANSATPISSPTRSRG